MEDVRIPIRELHLFAGAGGGLLGGILLGHTCVCAVEIEPYCRKVLLQRQRDGILPKFPIWDDVRTFDGRPWRGLVDVVCGGFPCQDISVAGKGAGITGERSGLWSEMARIIGEVRPGYVFVENSPALTFRGGVRVVADLAGMGYVGRWGVLGGSDANVPQKRDRIWIVAINSKIGLTNSTTLHSTVIVEKFHWRPPSSFYSSLPRESRPPVCDNFTYRKDNGLAVGVDRLNAIGNGQIPAVARLAWELLT